MDTPYFSKQALIDKARFSLHDYEQIRTCRRSHNQLGFAYQLAFVKLVNRFPETSPLEVVDTLVIYVSYQLSIPTHELSVYQHRLQTIYEHQDRISNYLQLTKFGKVQTEQLSAYIFEQAFRTEQMEALKALAKKFLTEIVF